MPPVLIENPIINSPFSEPKRHYRFDENNQITADIASGRLKSSYFQPVPAPKKNGKNFFDSLLADQKKAESDHVNRVRELACKNHRRGRGERREMQKTIDFFALSALSAVNNLGTFGRWGFLQIDGSNRHETMQAIRKFTAEGAESAEKCKKQLISLRSLRSLR